MNQDLDQAPPEGGELDRDEAIRVWHQHCDKFSDALGTVPPPPVIDAMLAFARAHLPPMGPAAGVPAIWYAPRLHDVCTADPGPDAPEYIRYEAATEAVAPAHELTDEEIEQALIAGRGLGERFMCAADIRGARAVIAATRAASASRAVAAPPNDEECDKLAAQAMDAVAKARDMHALALNPDITVHHALRRALIRAGFAAASQQGSQSGLMSQDRGQASALEAPTDEQIDNLLHALPARPWGIGSRIQDARAAVRVALASFNAQPEGTPLGWSETAPPTPGIWLMSCRETNDVERVKVERHFGGELWAVDTPVGSLPVRMYHDGLTNAIWATAAAGSPSPYHAPAHASKPNGFSFDPATEEVSLSYEDAQAPAVGAEPIGYLNPKVLGPDGKIAATGALTHSGVPVGGWTLPIYTAPQPKAAQAALTDEQRLGREARLRAAGMSGLLSEILGKGALSQYGDADLIERVEMAVADQEAASKPSVQGTGGADV